MLENLFLIYANYSLSHNPENLYEIFQEVCRYTAPDWSTTSKESVLERIKDILGHMENLSEYGQPPKQEDDVYYEYYEPYYNKRADWGIFSYLIAYEAMFGYRNEYCEEGCFKKWSRIKLGEDKFKGPKRINCYECGRLYFVNIFSGLVEGLEYSKISGLDRLLRNAYSNIGKIILITEVKSKLFFKERLTEALGWDLSLVFPEETDDLRGKFLSFLEWIIGYSLTEFLLHNDRRKLKKCPYCHKFFIAKDIKRQRCYSDDCRKTFERIKKQKQRDEDPVKYY
ncbi:MAG TPA: hypothetical protein VMW89_06095 [Desulfatiglandales bacterium]|nr:hypothetical protein [Desulfatiglandales bacterium]